jgi:hypothetical protein
VSKGKPKPVRFSEGDSEVIALLMAKTGLTRPEVLRRCVRFLYAETMRRPDWNWIADTAQEIPLSDKSEAEKWLSFVKTEPPESSPVRRKGRSGKPQPPAAGKR